ncbi:MAG: prepilin-type N-terminal cleavage/methylation domain-containing protein [Acidobacteria bacterium]|nr:prepilin-type N-terminal cleavage/methylation domain-containing protein [Acidobacteriota bacterium]MDW7984655.1 prepilin-type N-terminal cleavage/methylation domain-containing protein [Acidobacteriota bacterium]
MSRPREAEALGVRASHRGFSLVEALVAMAILIVGVLGLMTLFVYATRMGIRAGHMSVLNHLVAEKIDQIRSLDFDHPDLSPGIHPAIAPVGGGTEYYYPVPGFSADWSLRWVVTENTPEPNMKTVVVEAGYLVRYDSTGHRLPLPRGAVLVRHVTFLAR